MKEYKLDKSTFMGGWYIPENICDDLINLYIKNLSKTVKGKLGANLKTKDNLKKSTELIMQFDNQNLKNYNKHLNDVLTQYKKKYPFSDKVYYYNIKEVIKIQYYKRGEGFYTWHTENEGHRYGRARHLVFMTYLNTVKNAGTEFYHQDLQTPCEKGLTLIWPSAWTHMHRGVISQEEEKFIITGWYSFDN